MKNIKFIFLILFGYLKLGINIHEKCNLYFILWIQPCWPGYQRIFAHFKKTPVTGLLMGQNGNGRGKYSVSGDLTIPLKILEKVETNCILMMKQARLVTMGEKKKVWEQLLQLVSYDHLSAFFMMVSAENVQEEGSFAVLSSSTLKHEDESGNQIFRCFSFWFMKEVELIKPKKICSITKNLFLGRRFYNFPHTPNRWTSNIYFKFNTSLQGTRRTGLRTSGRWPSQKCRSGGGDKSR